MEEVTPDSDVAGGCLGRLVVSGLALGQRVEGNQRAQGSRNRGREAGVPGGGPRPFL